MNEPWLNWERNKAQREKAARESAIRALLDQLAVLEVPYTLRQEGTGGEFVLEVPGKLAAIRLTAMWLSAERLTGREALVLEPVTGRRLWFVANKVLLLGHSEQAAEVADVVRRIHTGDYARELLGEELFKLYEQFGRDGGERP